MCTSIIFLLLQSDTELRHFMRCKDISELQLSFSNFPVISAEYRLLIQLSESNQRKKSNPLNCATDEHINFLIKPAHCSEI